MSGLSFSPDWICPITQDLMRDPVIGPDGYTYERGAIETWLSSNAISPMTRQRMTTTTLTPNLALRHTIEDFLRAHPASAGAAAAATQRPKPFVSAELALTAKQFTVEGKHWLHVRAAAAPAHGEQRQPVVLLAIVDNSGSMAEPAAPAAGSGAELGYTRLDLVKHAVRTMAAILGPDDKFGIVSFSNDARVLLTPTAMDDAGRARVNSALDSLHPDASTNIFDGIKKAAALIADPAYNQSHIVGMLLTDGFPNINPPRGIVPTLQNMTMPNPWTLHTFGFGYSLDSALLAELAEWGHGLFGFIPDATMVGTVFINALAHTLSMASLGETFTFSDGGRLHTHFTGPVAYGQPRDYLFEIQDTVTNFNTTAVPAGDPEHVLIHRLFVDTIKTALQRAKSGAPAAETKALLMAFADTFSALDHPIVKALLRDLRSDKEGEGQVGMAPEYFTRWGEHYMRAYIRAQTLQQCMNFKDPGLQIYGGDLFHSLQDLGDKVFCDLPAPTPSRAVYSSYGGAGVAAPAGAAAPILSMSVFHNASAGCFAPETLIRMADGTHTMITELQRGDVVFTPDGPANVVALVVCGSYNRTQPMTMLGSLVITPWHPVRRNYGAPWEYPADIAGYHDRLMSTVYNLVLDKHHVVVADGYHALTLGHHILEPVAAHPYFGTDAVIHDLMKQPGWAEGRPTYRNLVATRDPTTGLINGWKDDV